MKQIEELKQAKFANSLQSILLAKRRANTTLEDYEVRIRKQQQYIPAKSADQICYLCKSHYVKFVTTTCEHCFCEKCLFDHLLICHKRCPKCKQVLRGTITTPTLAIDYWLEKILKDNTEYAEKLKEVELWKQDKRVTDFVIDAQLDVLDTEYIWCIGEIKKIKYDKDGEPTAVLIHYQGWNKVYDEMISADSERLSPFGQYTKKKGVLAYQAAENETVQRVLNTSGSQRFSGTSSMLLLQRLMQRWGNINNNNPNNPHHPTNRSNS